MLWNKIGLLPRLLFFVVLVIFSSGGLLSYLQMADESAYVREHHLTELRDTQRFLDQLLPKYVVNNNVAAIQQVFGAQIGEPSNIGRIEWQSGSGLQVIQDGGKVPLSAPEWFVRFAPIPPEELISSINVGEANFGTLKLRIDPVPSINRLWQHLSTQLKIIALANFAVILLLVLLLRGNLKTLRQLSISAIRFKRGDYSARVEAGGDPEINGAAQAFNRMAEEVEHLLQSLDQSENRFRAIFDQTFQFAGLLDREGILLEANQGVLDAAGIRASEVVGRPLWDTPWWDPAEAPRLREAVERAAHGEFVRYETYFLGSDGMPRAVDFSLKPFREKNKEITWLIAEGRDITSLKQAEAELRAEKVRAQVTLSSIGDAVITTDAMGRVEYLNPVAEQLTGWASWEAHGLELQKVFNVVGETPRLPLATHAARMLVPGTVIELESNGLLRTRGGREVSIEESVAPIRDGNGDVLGCVLVFHDVSEKRRLMQQITWQAGHDALTKLPNRSLLADRLELAISSAKRMDKLLMVGFIDLDKFKEINDLYGHELGDLLLIEVAHRLTLSVRGGDTVSRLGGDEFVLLLTNVADLEEAEAALQRILLDIARPYQVNGLIMQLTASIGATIYPLNDTDSGNLLRHADQALYQAKQTGRNRFCLFDISLDKEVRFLYQEQERIAQALAQGEMELYYQPKVNMRTGEVFGFEALLRWNHPERGLVMPMEYLPLIEQTDLIKDIGMWVMRDVLRQLAVWRAEGLNTLVSINLGACHFRSMEFVDQLRDVLAEYPSVPPSSLELEILECAALDDIQTVRSIMLGCQELGVSFALDDFGAGYSSLAYLKRLPANMLKIDRSFIHNMLEDSGDLTIIEGVVSMASIFNLDVIAEGVETMEQGVMLMRLGCGKAQGYGIAHPMPASKVPYWIEQFKPDPGWLRWANTRWDLADFPLLMAQSDHVQWVKRVMMAIEGATLMLSEGELKSHHHCRFGHWYYGHGKERYGHLTGYYDLEPIHTMVHEVGAELIRLRGAGEVEAVAELCPKLMKLNGEVLDKLADLQKAVIRTLR
ncbi:hypothetical protein SCD_n01125 [Sulfuricella denitrificans skB26]|uniref:PAS/PAC sensor-containing diguanylate cyclase/phosphodiesterase n=1 Tax=Sulfuricella denitrificans (strain DSM 22764 / NBRC 105220 / skB26) TaxID=1163617 RepID=S6AK35_SULDS|nr:EAL domain-containing protein [Sulfuricella denitrificans]BAN34959.1 hypothetical protein SCD_n01125 [Sulfuricella denitrificans skB26]